MYVINHLRGTEARALVACLALLASGCSSLTPQIFSERLLAQRDADGKYKMETSEPPPSLELAYADAAFVQRRYISAVQDQGNATPQISAALIGLSALTLFKAITGANTNDLAAAGIVGSTVWVYGNTLLSKPRLDVYRAGADALMCAMAAVEPLRKGQQTLGQPTDGAEEETLYGRRAAVTKYRAALESLLRQHASLTDIVVTDVPGQPKQCKVIAVPATCPAIPAGTPKDEVTLLQARCRKLPSRKVERCTQETPAGKRSVAAPAAAFAAVSEARTQITGAAQQLKSAGRVIDTLTEAGPLLWKKSVQIQLMVSAEVDKTVPDLASVLAAAGGMRDIGFALTGFTGFKPGTAQGVSKARGLTQDQSQAVKAIEDATDALRDARVALEDLAGTSLGTGHAQARKTLNDCALKVSGVKLNVTPAGDSIPVALGGSTVFFVSGGSGVPSGAVISGPKPAPLPLKLEGGQFRFEFATPQGVAVGDTLMLRFSDGAGAVEKLVEVIVTEAPTPSTGTPPANTGEPKPADVAGGATASGKFKDMVDEEKTLLGLPATATDAEIQAAIDSCQKTAQPRIKVTGNFDPETKKALKSDPKTCKPKP